MVTSLPSQLHDNAREVPFERIKVNGSLENRDHSKFEKKNARNAACRGRGVRVTNVKRKYLIISFCKWLVISNDRTNAKKAYDNDPHNYTIPVLLFQCHNKQISYYLRDAAWQTSAIYNVSVTMLIFVFDYYTIRYTRG